MAEPTAPARAPTASDLWSELESLARREVGERAYVERLLELWSGALGAAGAALYLEREGSDAAGRAGAEASAELLREVAVGEGPFPGRLDQTHPAGAEGFVSWRLPGGLLVARRPGEAAAVAPEVPAPPEPLTLLLTTALRALKLRKQLKQQHFQVNYRVVELESVYEVGLAIASTLDLDQLSEEILLRAMSLLDARRGGLYRRDGDVYRLDRTFGGEARDAFAVDDPALEPLLAGKGPGPDGLVPGARHLMAVAIGAGPRLGGLIVVADKESRRGVGPFGASDRRTLSLFANQAAIALENARLHRQALEKERLEREMELAAEIQRQILPDGAPVLPGWELVGWNRPARQVGGDYYDLLARGQRLTFTIADVTGKGIAAALLVSTLHSALHLLLDRVEVGPELFQRLNRHILDSSSRNKFITLLLADLDPATGELDFLNAGHNPGLLLRGGGEEVCELSPGGLPLGLMEGGDYPASHLVIRPGDLLCLYTDGITECVSPNDEEFGPQRLVECLVQMQNRPLGEVVACIDRATQEFAAGQPQLDDQTVILLRRAAA
jgi:sigma-B regulation protein RsbU (phosphoserine phosphatase)